MNAPVANYFAHCNVDVDYDNIEILASTNKNVPHLKTLGGAVHPGNQIPLEHSIEG